MLNVIFLIKEKQLLRILKFAQNAPKVLLNIFGVVNFNLIEILYEHKLTFNKTLWKFDSENWKQIIRYITTINALSVDYS